MRSSKVFSMEFLPINYPMEAENQRQIFATSFTST